MPLYRRVPKLKGIAGGMSAGLPNHVTINIKSLGERFSEGEVVSLESLKSKSLLNVSGRDRRLPLKVLGDGDLPFPLTFQAESFSALAKEKIEAGGGTVDLLPGKVTWTRKRHEAAIRALGGKKPKKRPPGRPKKVWPEELRNNPNWKNPGKEAQKKGGQLSMKKRREKRRVVLLNAQRQVAAKERKAVLASLEGK